MRFGHNFWLEGPIDLRPKRLNCILQDLFRDTPPDHIWRAQICAQMCQIWPNMHFLLVYKFEFWHETSFCPKELACQRLRLKSKKIETCYLYSVWICLLWQQGPYCLHEYCIRLEAPFAFSEEGGVCVEKSYSCERRISSGLVEKSAWCPGWPTSRNHAITLTIRLNIAKGTTYPRVECLCNLW